MKLRAIVGRLFIGLVCCGHVVVFATACMLASGDSGVGLVGVSAVGLSQVGLTALLAGLGSWPFMVRVPAWAIVCTVPLITIWLAGVHAQPGGEWLSILAAVAASWVLSVFLLTAVRVLPFLRLRLAHLGHAEDAARPVHKQYSLLQLFIIVAAFAVALSLVHQLKRMPCPWGELLDGAYHMFASVETALVVFIVASVHVTAGVLFLAKSRWLAWLGVGIGIAAIVAMWALWGVEVLYIGIWLAVLVITLLAVRACGTRWITQRHAATNERDEPLPTTRAQKLAALVRSPAAIALFAVCALFLWITLTGSLVTCPLVLASYAQHGGSADVPIDLRDVPREELPLSSLKRVYSLDYLDLHGTGITDDDLQYIRALPNLETLDLSSTKVTDEGLSSLDNLASLCLLHVEDTKVTFSGVCHLIRHAPSLGEVLWKRGSSLEAYWTTDSWMEAATRLEVFPPNYFQAISMQDRFLCLSGDCTREELRLVGTLPIQHLCFCRGRLTEDACQTLPSLSNVESVTLCKVNGAGIAAKHVAKMPSLKGLVCVGGSIHDDVFPVFDKLSRLETLGLGSTTTVPDLSAVRELDSLTTLTLDDTPISDISPLADLANLEFIALRRTAVTDLTPLARLPKLRELSISGTRVLDLSPLAKTPTLKHLWLSDTQTPAKEVAKLRKTLPRCKIAAF